MVAIPFKELKVVFGGRRGINGVGMELFNCLHIDFSLSIYNKGMLNI